MRENLVFREEHRFSDLRIIPQQPSNLRSNSKPVLPLAASRGNERFSRMLALVGPIFENVSVSPMFIGCTAVRKRYRVATRGWRVTARHVFFRAEEPPQIRRFRASLISKGCRSEKILSGE